MTMASGNSDYRLHHSGVDERDSFQEHNQHMKEFRLNHSKDWKQWGILDGRSPGCIGSCSDCPPTRSGANHILTKLERGRYDKS